MRLDFEPDTFGHSLQVPEILASAGVNYYYRCRGSEGPQLYRWEGSSGQSVIAYREPTWYNDYVQAMLGAYVPDICRRTGLSTHLSGQHLPQAEGAKRKKKGVSGPDTPFFLRFPFVWWMVGRAGAFAVQEHEHSPSVRTMDPLFV